MLRPRIIPSLLLHDKGLVKTVNFKTPKYVGDPINTVRIFNEKGVDELAFFDIDATVLNKEPDYLLIEKLANQSRMPLCYGGGVKTVEQAQKIFGLGIEKIALSSAVVYNPELVIQIAERVGSQSVIIVLDIKKKLLGGYEVFTHNGKKSTGINPIKFARELEALGAGEIIINSIDQDGVMKGYDINLIDKMAETISIPLTVLGGAGSLADIEKVIEKHGVIGVASGSLFVFKGPYKAVLINYPTQKEKNEIFKINQNGYTE
jgi:imidazole glycerol-phosphate synthase subunit HisF